MSNALSFQQSDRDEAIPRSIQLARRLLAPELTLGTADPEVAAVGLRRTCERISVTLRNALGVDGSSALFHRALMRTEAAHPSLAGLRGSDDRHIAFEGLAASVDAHGIGAVSAGVEALLAALIDILVRLIGEEMTIRLTAAEAASPTAPNGGASHS